MVWHGHRGNVDQAHLFRTFGRRRDTGRRCQGLPRSADQQRGRRGLEADPSLPDGQRGLRFARHQGQAPRIGRPKIWGEGRLLSFHPFSDQRDARFRPAGQGQKSSQFGDQYLCHRRGSL